MSQQETQEINRILVALDDSPASRTALETAAEMAAGFQAELVGLYVEDVNLIRVAELSFTQEVGLFSGTSRRLEIRQVERGFRSQARRARQVLATVAKKAQVDWSFQVGRGMIAAVLLAAAAEADLVVLGRRSQSLMTRRRLGSTARSILVEGTQLTLLLQPGVGPGQPVMVIYDGSATSQKALATTARLTRDKVGTATVLILANEADRAEMLRQEAGELSARQEMETEYHWLMNPTVRRLARFINDKEFRLVVLSEANTLSRMAMLSLLDEIDAPVLLVR
jgi:nucleotide-binding universal stress UspA family protein